MNFFIHRLESNVKTLANIRYMLSIYLNKFGSYKSVKTKIYIKY